MIYLKSIWPLPAPSVLSNVSMIHLEDCSLWVWEGSSPRALMSHFSFFHLFCFLFCVCVSLFCCLFLADIDLNLGCAVIPAHSYPEQIPLELSGGRIWLQ